MILKRIIISLAILYIAILIVMMANETSLVYPGSKYPRGNWEPTGFKFEEVQFQAGDGTKLVGWYLPHPRDQVQGDADSSRQPAVETALLCHGNAENIAQSAASIGIRMRDSLNANVFVFDYRGFGKSEGTPNEAGVLDDSESGLKWLIQKSGKSADEIILIGHSIGGGPAVHLASKFGAKALILQRTFNSITEPAQRQYPWLPIRYLMRNRYPSEEKIKHYHGPVFQSHGVEDRLIPIEMGKALFDAAPTGNKRFVRYPNLTHWDALPESYWTELNKFIASLTEPEQIAVDNTQLSP